MAVHRVKKESIPRRRTKTGFLAKTEEWRDAVSILSNGLSPAEAIEVTLSPQTKTLFRAKRPHESFTHAMKQHIKRLGLKYDCFCVNETVYIVGR